MKEYTIRKYIRFILKEYYINERFGSSTADKLIVKKRSSMFDKNKIKKSHIKKINKDVKNLKDNKEEIGNTPEELSKSEILIKKQLIDLEDAN